MAASKSGDSLTAEETSAGIAALSDADWARIKKVSVLLTGCKEAARDLRQEAIARALGGERNCPRDVTVAKFLCEAMSSIIWSQRNADAVRSKTELAYVTDPTSCGRPERADDSPFAVLVSDEECQRIVDSVLQLFDDNQVAQDVTEGIMEGLEGEDLSKLAGIETKELASNRRLIRRRVDGAFPKGWHDGK
jgi:DNA-directed RNA polymerase specialized sigma24 family protein